MMWWWNDASQGEGWRWWWMLTHGIWPIILLALLIGGVILLVRFLDGGNGTVRRLDSTALEILERRYASGEINREEYLQKRHDILDRAAA
jgi:putative membrane protein